VMQTDAMLPMGGQVNTPEGLVIEADDLLRVYSSGELQVQALQGLDLRVQRGEIVALVGPSGAGKSTLMSALGGLDRPSAGRLVVDGRDLQKLSLPQLTRYRREQVGFVWQQTSRNLLPYLSGRENIALLLGLSGTVLDDPVAWIDELLDAVVMREHAGRALGELSGGQQQRIAIACALANRPVLLLGDEPTGEVDWQTAEAILRLFDEVRRRYGTTIVMVTHDPRVAATADRIIDIRDGRSSSEVRNRAPAGEPRETWIVDASGRIQLPIEFRQALGIGRRAALTQVDGVIRIMPVPSDDHVAVRRTGMDDPADLAAGLYDDQAARRERWRWLREAFRRRRR
jgi:peptide/nickel transport system ATP-binding protein